MHVIQGAGLRKWPNMFSREQNLTFLKKLTLTSWSGYQLQLRFPVIGGAMILPVNPLDSLWAQ
jgi:hypothetical protein